MSFSFNQNKETKPEDAVVTGVQSSLQTGLAAAAADLKLSEELTAVEGSMAGHLSYGVSYITLKDGTKVAGISTDRGFFYPAELGEEVADIMADYVKRGFAYDLSNDTE